MTDGFFVHRQGSQPSCNIDLYRRLVGGIVTGERHGRLDHRFHFIEIVEHFGALFVIIDKLRSQAHAGNWRAQIVGDRGQHLGAVLNKALQADLHGVEGARSAAHFAGAGLGQRRGVEFDPQAFGCGGEQGHRPGGAAHRVDGRHRNEECQHRGEDERPGALAGFIDVQIDASVEPHIFVDLNGRAYERLEAAYIAQGLIESPGTPLRGNARRRTRRRFSR